MFKKDEGGRMKDEESMTTRGRLILHPSSLILHPFERPSRVCKKDEGGRMKDEESMTARGRLILHPSSLILHPFERPTHL